MKFRDGSEVRIFEDPSKLPLQRMIAYMARLDESGIGVSGELYDLFQRRIDEFIEVGDYDKVKILNDQMRALRSDHSTVEICLRLVDCFTLLKGEPIDQISHSHYQMKVELCERDEEALAFFLTQALPFVSATKTLPKNLNLLDYLKETGRWQLQKRLIRLISGRVFKVFYPKYKS